MLKNQALDNHLEPSFFINIGISNYLKYFYVYHNNTLLGSQCQKIWLNFQT